MTGYRTVFQTFWSLHLFLTAIIFFNAVESRRIGYLWNIQQRFINFQICRRQFYKLGKSAMLLICLQDSLTPLGHLQDRLNKLLKLSYIPDISNIQYTYICMYIPTKEVFHPWYLPTDINGIEILKLLNKRRQIL